MSQSLISNPDGQPLPVPKFGGIAFKEVNAEQLAILPPDTLSQGHKTPAYFLNRFLHHPLYRYRVFLAQGKDGMSAFFAMRIAEHADARALRIVDFYGDTSIIAGCGDAIAEVMRGEKAEYADFWQAGIPDGDLQCRRILGHQFGWKSRGSQLL